MWKCFQYKGMMAIPLFGVVFIFFMWKYHQTSKSFSFNYYIHFQKCRKNSLSHSLTNLQFMQLIFFFIFEGSFFPMVSFSVSGVSFSVYLEHVCWQQIPLLHFHLKMFLLSTKEYFHQLKNSFSSAPEIWHVVSMGSD